MARQSMNVLDQVAQELADYVDHMADELAEELMAGGSAPFSAPLTEQQKLEFYTNQLFNPDGSVNHAGRAAQMQRLGPEAFALVFKAVIHAHPTLMIPSPPPGATIAPSPFPTASPPGPHLPGIPPSYGMPRSTGQQIMSEQSNLGPAAGTGPLG